MNVVQLIDSVKRGGGAESLVYNFARTARDHDIKCHVVTLFKNDPELCAELKVCGVEVVDVAARRLIDPVRYSRLIKCLKYLKPDVVHTHLRGSTILGVSAARMLNIPSIVTLHTEVLTTNNHLYHGKLERWVLRNWADCIIAVGSQTADAHRSNVGNTPIEVVPNAVRKPPLMEEVAKLKLRRSLFPDYDGPIIVSVGRLAPPKGYADLVRALSKLNRQFKCIILGRGPLLDELEKLTKDLHLDEHVKFLGLRADVQELLGISDLYVSSSHWEGLPMATLEAMYARLPIVSTRVGDAEHILRDNAGLLVEPRDPDSLAATIDKLLSDKNLCSILAGNAFARVDAEYNNDQWMSRQKEIYKKVCATS